MNGDKWFEKVQELEILVDRIKNHCEVVDEQLEEFFKEFEDGDPEGRCEDLDVDMARAEGAHNIIGQILQLIKE